MLREYEFGEGGYTIKDQDNNDASSAMLGAPGWTNPDPMVDTPTIYIEPLTTADLTIIELKFYVNNTKEVQVIIENPNPGTDFPLTV